MGVGRKGDGGQVILQGPHLAGVEHRVSAHQAHVGAVEFLQAVPIAAPVKRLMADDVLQGLGDHGAFHGMKVWALAGLGIGDAVLIKGLHVTGGVTQIPGQTIAASVNVAGTTGKMAGA